MSIIKIVRHTHNYVILDKTCLEDTVLSFRAKGLHAYLMSKPDNWRVRECQLLKASTEGRDALRTAMKELVVARYVTRHPLRDKGTGQMDGWEWIVTEEPSAGPETRITGNPPGGEPPASKEGPEAKKDKRSATHLQVDGKTDRPLTERQKGVGLVQGVWESLRGPVTAKRIVGALAPLLKEVGPQKAAEALERYLLRCAKDNFGGGLKHFAENYKLYAETGPTGGPVIYGEEEG